MNGLGLEMFIKLGLYPPQTLQKICLSKRERETEE